MRFIFAIFCICTAAPGAAWEFTSRPVCTLSHIQDSTTVTIVHDPRADKPFSLTLHRAEGWPPDPVFAIRFDPVGPIISTDRHEIKGKMLSARDTGFGNVLAGLEANRTAIAQIGETRIAISLENAARQVARFRSCLITPSV